MFGKAILPVSNNIMGSVWARLVCLQWLAVRITMSTLSNRASNEGYVNANVIRDGQVRLAQCILNVKALKGAFNQEIRRRVFLRECVILANLHEPSFQALMSTLSTAACLLSAGRSSYKQNKVGLCYGLVCILIEQSYSKLYRYRIKHLDYNIRF